jgi:phosphate-selective porin
LSAILINAQAADQALLDVLLENGVIDHKQYEVLSQKSLIQYQDLMSEDEVTNKQVSDHIDSKIERAVAERIDAEVPVKISHGKKGFRFETRDGNWQTNLQWRAQFRYTDPSTGDPRQLSKFNDEDQSTLEARRLRMKIGGHGYQPWLKYYFEVDLQPGRDVDDDSSKASARVIDYRLDINKWDWGGFRVGQWKVDYNRERVDSSGRQQFVERSIANRIFTVDRQLGVQLRGHAFRDTHADMRYFLGAFNGEGRGVRNSDDNMLYVGRLQWNFLGRDLALRQTDVEYTQLPTASLAIGGATTQGPCTRWSSSGCGNLDGFASPSTAVHDQYEIDQYVQELAFKWKGFSLQQEWHRKTITDTLTDEEYDLTGGYLQSGYFFHNLIPAIPESLEFAARYAFVEEPNKEDLAIDNDRQEMTLGANWFFKGHNNKLTLDWSRLSLDDNRLKDKESESRIRLQWDVSF